MSASATIAPFVPVIRLRGELTPRHGNVIDTIGPLIDQAFEAAGARGTVILDIESPGGSPVQAELLANRLRRRAEERQARLIALIGEICAAGAYWVACAADDIVAHAMSVVGLNGVIGVSGIIEGGLEANETLRRLSTEGMNAALGGGNLAAGAAIGVPSYDEYGSYPQSGLRGFGSRRQSDAVYAKRLLDDLQEQYKVWVQMRRGSRLQVDATPIFTGSLVLGEQAVTVGLVDRLGDLESLVEEIGGAAARPRILTNGSLTTAEMVRFAMDAARTFVEQRVRLSGVRR
ncbi:MAG: S49 family peptidase [Acidisphaera sp.]|nr:S49 family peptidase [Acidisphaera sp.]